MNNSLLNHLVSVRTKLAQDVKHLESEPAPRLQEPIVLSPRRHQAFSTWLSGGDPPPQPASSHPDYVAIPLPNLHQDFSVQVATHELDLVRVGPENDNLVDQDFLVSFEILSGPVPEVNLGRLDEICPATSGSSTDAPSSTGPVRESLGVVCNPSTRERTVVRALVSGTEAEIAPSSTEATFPWAAAPTTEAPTPVEHSSGVFAYSLVLPA